MTKFIFAYVFFLNQIFAPYVYADKYKDDAKKFVQAHNNAIKEMAKESVVSQFANLGSAFFFESIFSEESQKQLVESIQKKSEDLVAEAANLLTDLKDASSGEVDIKSADVKVQNFVRNISALSNRMQRLSWGLRDYMDRMYGANDWMLQAINGFQDRCELGYYKISGAYDVSLETKPEVFKSDLSMFINVSVLLDDMSAQGAEQDQQYLNHNEITLHPENYGDVQDIKNLQEAQKVSAYATSLTSGVGLSLAVNGGTFLGAGAATWGTAAAASFGAGVAIAAAIYIVGSYEAYKEQKKWARAEVYKFLNTMDSDDFAKIYRDECLRFKDNIDILKNQIVKLNTDSAFKKEIVAEVQSIPYGQCGRLFEESELNKKEDALKKDSEQEFGFTEKSALAVLKYYQCTTQVHGPKMFFDITEKNLAEISSRLISLREYLANYISIISNIKNDYMMIMPYSQTEIKIERLYKNLVVAATGVILGLNSKDDYFYNKKSLIQEMEKADFKVMDRVDLLEGIQKIENHVKKYIE